MINHRVTQSTPQSFTSWESQRSVRRVWETVMLFIFFEYAPKAIKQFHSSRVQQKTRQKQEA